MLIQKIFITLILALTTIASSYAEVSIKNTHGILVDVTLHQSMNNANTFTTKNKIFLTRNDNWTAISGSQSTNTITNPKKGNQPPILNQSLALMKITQANNKYVALQFLILNQESSHYSVVEPRMMVNYNQKGSIHIQDKQNKIELIVIAKKS